MINRLMQLIRGKENGQAFILVILLMLLGGLVLPPTLYHATTALKAGELYETKIHRIHAVDCGLDDALWYVKYGDLEGMFPSSGYDIYDFSTTWGYDLPEEINRNEVSVSLQNIWIPTNIAVPWASDARDIIEDGRLIISSSVPETSTCEINIVFYPNPGDDLNIESLGIWLPPGFSYVADSANLDEPSIQAHAGGQVLLWSFTSEPFDSFPGVNPGSDVLASTVTFQFASAQAGSNPEAVAWITTSGVSGVSYTWDADTHVYHIVSQAGPTRAEAYHIKSELRKLGSSIGGDYRAVDSTLMIDQYPGSGGPKRDTLFDESSATVADIPLNAEVAAAYLYWSGWFAQGTAQPIWEDECYNYGNWDNPGSSWDISSGSFRGHHLGGGPDWLRYLEMKDSLDLSGYESGTVKIGWEQWEEGWLESSDALRYQFSGNGGDTWSSMKTAFYGNIGSAPQYYSTVVPDGYLTDDFKFRFYLRYFGGSGEYCYIDNFDVSETTVAADTSAVFKINGAQVYFNGLGEPQIDLTGTEEVTAGRWTLLENQSDEYSYSSFADVTRLVQEFSDEGSNDNHTGNGTYTVGNVYAETGNEWSYAAWSLVIIYSSPETKGHQLYLYDNFIYSGMNQNVDFDDDGQPGGTVSGFLTPEQVPGDPDPNTATITCFVGEGDDAYNGDSLVFNGMPLSDGITTSDVWNSWSLGMVQDGIDIDTFKITWLSGLLQPGDTAANIDMPTQTDSWNLVYIILSFRSSITTGDAISYLLEP